MGFYGNATYYLPNGIAQDVVDGVITTKKLAKDAVIAEKIANGQVHGSGNNDKSPNYDHIASRSIGTNDIAIGAIKGGENGNIGPNTIIGYNIRNKSINGSGDENGLDDIESSQIAKNTIGLSNMGKNSIGEKQIINNSIHGSGDIENYPDYQHIAPGSIGANDIANEIITGSMNPNQGHIAPHTITGYNIDYGTIDGSGDENGLDDMEFSHIGENTIGLSNMGKDSVGTDQIIDSSIKTDKIHKLAITREKIAGRAIGYLEIEPENIYGRAFTNSDEADSVQKSYSHIKECSIAGGDNGDIAFDTITGGSQKGKGNIAEKTIDTYNIADWAIKTDQIDMGAVTTDKIENNAVTMDELDTYSVHGLKGEKSGNGKNSHIFPESIAGGESGDIAPGTITDYNIDSISKSKINDMNCYEPVMLNSKTYVSVYSLIQVLRTFETPSPIFVTQGTISFNSRELPAGKYFIIPLSNTSWIFFNQKINTFYEIQDDTDEWTEGEDINSYIAIIGKNWAMEPYRERRISAITSVISNWDQYSLYTTYCEILNIVGESNLNSWNSAEECANSKATAPLPGQYLAIMLKQRTINSIYFIGLDHSHQYLSNYNTEHSSWLTQEITKSKIEISTFNKKELVSEGPQQNCQLQLNIQPNTIYYLDQAYDETLYYPFKYEGYNYIQLFKSEIFSQENSSTIYCSLPDDGSLIQNKTNLPMYCSLSGLPSIIVNIDGIIVSNDMLNKIYGTSTNYNIIMTIQQVKIQGLDALQCQITPWSDLLTYEDFYKE